MKLLLDRAALLEYIHTSFMPKPDFAHPMQPYHVNFTYSPIHRPSLLLKHTSCLCVV